MIIAMVIVGSVPIFLSVCLIVFLIETNAVSERKTVMRGDQIDGSGRFASIALKHVAGGRKTPGKLAERHIAL